MSSSRYLLSEVRQISINSNIMYSATFVFLETFFKWEGRWVKVKVLRNVRKGEQEYSKGKVGKSPSPKCTPRHTVCRCSIIATECNFEKCLYCTTYVSVLVVSPCIAAQLDIEYLEKIAETQSGNFTVSYSYVFGVSVCTYLLTYVPQQCTV